MVNLGFIFYSVAPMVQDYMIIKLKKVQIHANTKTLENKVDWPD